MSLVRRILLNLEPSVLQKALPDNDSGRDLELIDQWGVEDPQLKYILRALEVDLEAGVPGGRLFGDSCSARSRYIYNAVML